MSYWVRGRPRAGRRLVIMLATGLISLAVVGVAQAATLTVNSTADQDTGSCTSTTCTLRDAINYSSSGDTVAVPAGTYTLTQGELDVAHNLTIDGAGASSMTVSGDDNSRVFFVASGVTATISGVTVTGGDGNGSQSSGSGGGILSSGSLYLSDSIVTGNDALEGGGVWSELGTLSIDGSTISDNTLTSAPSLGAGIGCSGCSGMSVNDSTVSDNDATDSPGAGGGLYINTFLPAETAEITNTTLSGNSAAEGGGGVFLQNGALELANSTVSGNSAGYSGGGIWDGNVLDSVNNTVADNSAPDVANIYAFSPFTGRIENTVVAEPQGGGTNCGRVILFPFSLGHNLEDDAGRSCYFTAPGDISGVSADLGPLADNGGPTQTMALLAGSPAIDHGAAIPSITTDQRGGPRPQPAGGAYDIGAYERGAVVDTAIRKTASPDPARVGSHLTYTLTASNDGPSPDPAYAVSVVDKLPSSVKFDSAKPSLGSCSFSSGTLTCDLGTVDEGDSATVRVVVTPKKTGTVTNTGKVSSSAKDYDTANNQSTVKTTVKAALKAVAVTGAATQVKSSSARLHGRVKPNGASTTYYFQYGTSRRYGARTGSAGAGRGTSFRSVVRGVTGLRPGTRYHYRVVARNSHGTSFGRDRTFVTPSVKPVFTG